MYLSFDDGPSDSLKQILELLEREGARATFFFTASTVEARRSSITDVQSFGHEIGSHGLDHRSAWSHQASAIISDHARAIQVLEDVTGHRIAWARPPYGRLTPALWNWYRMSDLRVALWDVNPADYRLGSAPENVCRSIHKHARPGSIVLLHEDGKAWKDGFNKLGTMISEMRADGWQFEALPVSA